VNVLVRDIVRVLEEPSVIAGGLDELEEEEEEFVKRGRCPSMGEASKAAAIDGDTLLRKYQPLYSRVTTVAAGVALRFAQLSITAGSDHEAAMLFVSKSTEPFRVRSAWAQRRTADGAGPIDDPERIPRPPA
jgi:hypothetical protein